MPQDTLRSVVYRSFAHCDDPNGVVECGTIIKSKSGSRKMERLTQKDHWRVSNPSFVCKDERKELVSEDISRESDTPLPSQLLEVSRGAQKINDMIDSWSQGLSFDGQSKDIARDLLEGALDLQESLIMLGQLQKTSKYMSQFKKQKQKFEQEENELVVGRTYSDRYEFKNSPINLQKPRLSADGSPRNCSEDLKKLIRDSFSRQNLLPMHSTEDKVSWGRKKLDSDLDIPSTSSSRSTLVPSKSSASVNSSVSSAAQETKAKSLGLIAKLMGLEEFHSEPIQTSKRIMEGNKNSCQPRPIFDIERPKTRKPQFADSNMDPNRKKLKEIIETMHFKGLLKTKYVERGEFQSRRSDASCFKQRMDDEIPPIVIIKPLSSSVETEGPLLGKFIWDERALDPNSWLKLKEKKEPSRKMPTGEERKLELDHKKAAGIKTKEEPATKMFIREEGALEHKESPGKLDAEKEAQTIRLIREVAKNPKEKIRELEARELQNQGKASFHKMKSSIPLNNEAKKKEDNKKSEKAERVLSDRRKPQEKVNVKSVTMSRSQDHTRATSSKSQKQDRKFTMVKNRLTHQESTSQNPKATCSTKPVSQNSAKQVKRELAKKAKPIGGSLTIGTQSSQCKHKDKKTNLTCEIDSTLTTTNTLLRDQHPIVERTGLSEIHSGDSCEDWKNEVTPQTSLHESNTESAEEVNQLSSHETREQNNTVGTEVSLRSLLLRSPPFLSSVEEFFHLNVNKPIALEKAGIEEVGTTNSRVLLECANELLERKSLIRSQVVVPLLWIPNQRFDVHFDRLVEEVCNGVEDLKNYSKGGGNVLLMDSLYVMLERDLRGNGLVLTSLWDLGWKNGFSMDETGEVVGEVEKQLLDGLIEEFIIDNLC
ncbi:uncharacterized protein LOC122068385 [Macadamia integrifolia]|uniref:uncharacterized protein LOC122068385 n=1 Tax=Macadamia integrifolia TaxID=60698 RepID=UPI001C4ED7D3|nr:uncharacterized protein LOC122068385 [Macadamia integrifolia]XP_042488166.1 uncharacterized protein LOC122068385 [Macadamia integrifolia]